MSSQGEYSQPFQKPPHLEQPISTLFLSESTMAFGRSIVSDNEGNYKGPLMLSLKEGYALKFKESLFCCDSLQQAHHSNLTLVLNHDSETTKSMFIMRSV